MESMQFDKYVVLDILNRVHISIEHIEERSQPYHCGDDFLMSSTGVAILDSICMQFIAIGESLKGLDKVTRGELLTTHPEIDWKNVKGLCDIIAHHYFLQFCISKKINVCLKESLSNELRNGD